MTSVMTLVRCPRHDIINAQLGQKGPEFVHYVPTVLEWSKSITINIWEQLISKVSFWTPENLDVSSFLTSLLWCY